MKVTYQEQVNASTTAIFEYMTSPAYLEALKGAIDVVSSIEALDSQLEGATLKRTVRYEAPTAGKIPSFLKKYQDKAPAHVSWEERGVWDASRTTLRYQIVPELPEHWHKKYDVSGELKLVADGPTKTQLVVALEYEVKLFGFKRRLDQALKGEVEKILAIQAKITAQHFS